MTFIEFLGYWKLIDLIWDFLPVILVILCVTFASLVAIIDWIRGKY